MMLSDKSLDYFLLIKVEVISFNQQKSPQFKLIITWPIKNNLLLHLKNINKLLILKLPNNNKIVSNLANNYNKAVLKN